MRILYGVTGQGLGHTMRARVTAQELVARGHTVLVAASGRAVGILRSHGLTVVPIEGMKLCVEESALERARTVARLVRSVPAALRRNVGVGLEVMRDFAPDVLITDFDTFTSAVGLWLDRPVISLDHQHVLDRFRHPAAVADAVTGLRGTRAVVTGKTPRCAHYVVTSFFFPDAARRGPTSLVGPIVRPEVMAASAVNGDHVLVYQTSAGDPRLLPALAAVPEQRFVVYGLGRAERIGNIELREHDEAGFVATLASARAVIANGGYTTLSEAVYLGKPVLSVPVRRQAEQELNAAWLAHLGLGAMAREISPAVVRRFLDRAEEYGHVRDARVLSGNHDAMEAVERALAVAA